MEHLILRCRPRFGNYFCIRYILSGTFVVFAALFMQPAGISAANCLFESVPFPTEVPPLPTGTCATSPNMPAKGQPVLQNYSVTLAAEVNLLEKFRKDLKDKGWALAESKGKMMEHGEMSYFEATYQNRLKIRIMIHGAHHGNATSFTIALQEKAP